MSSKPFSDLKTFQFPKKRFFYVMWCNNEVNGHNTWIIVELVLGRHLEVCSISKMFKSKGMCVLVVCEWLWWMVVQISDNLYQFRGPPSYNTCGLIEPDGVMNKVPAWMCKRWPCYVLGIQLNQHYTVHNKSHVILKQVLNSWYLYCCCGLASTSPVKASFNITTTV